MKRELRAALEPVAAKVALADKVIALVLKYTTTPTPTAERVVKKPRKARKPRAAKPPDFGFGIAASE